MHYLNGREAKIGDWVVGPTHSSSNELRIGLVQEVFTKERGDCNLRIHIWIDDHFTEMGAPRTITAIESHGYDEYADAKKCILCKDGLRMIHAVNMHGMWNSPYL